VRARTLVPLALAAAYALWTFRPEPGFLPGGVFRLPAWARPERTYEVRCG
jgi:hypothetical protein